VELKSLVLSVDILNIGVAAIGLRLVVLWLSNRQSSLSQHAYDMIEVTKATHSHRCTHVAGSAFLATEEEEAQERRNSYRGPFH
jgi:high-affinity Fe2+/Pb2+ permease